MDGEFDKCRERARQVKGQEFVATNLACAEAEMVNGSLRR